MDTYGREFVFVYPPNNSGSNGMSVTLSVINPDTKQHAAVTINYPEFDATGDNITVIRRTATLVVKVLSDELFNFNESVILDSIVDGLRSYVDARIVVHSTIPITLIAHSMDVSGAHDSFLVLPVSMAGNHYVFTLPPSSSSGSTIVYFLPAKPEPKQYIRVNLIREASSCSCKHTVQVGEMLVFSLSEESVTFLAHSDFPFVIVAAVRKLPTMKGSNVFDFGCFMPSSMPTTHCDKLSVNDNHIAPLLTGKYHLLTPPSVKCESLEISIHGSNKVVKQKRLISAFIQTTNPMIFDGFGNTAAITTAMMLNVIRYGGYNIGALNYEEGGYLHEIPAISQFITGMLPIIVPGDSNQVTVIADSKAMSSCFFDGEINLSFAALPFLNGSFYYASGTVTSGFHFFYADGLYIIFITGRTNNSAYGFIPAFNSKYSLLILSLL
uniref:IgGFc_binding domain-containing protein n=1 Tax=Elaeophora elaphi TaxID=1147741 RepID=A0A0R3RII3_9BILA